MKTAVTLTENAKQHLIKTLEHMNKPYIVFGLKGGGCAGFEYFWLPASEEEYQMNGTLLDEIIALDDTRKFVVDSTSVMYLLGSVIDYKMDFISSQLIVENPNATSSCGCGTSIAV
jgi:iron-sulfur cluster insertion protein